ncbi:hypothetical protein Rsub_10234 [Raphidocelis subcapitata]|uniref:Methyltransferase domain-containing protein n=1 Tax=Raphidocelis subcapitata TaxID=307507 RepID=A0A2V0PED7_9CHLO|nr:hypothetical protein Rsub_10234 [Raphidocelis subcapitata]|eukprot:GBF97879.1 hypothetical protein Rsub_10234 [Raphidocelis subcapitata]
MKAPARACAGGPAAALIARCGSLGARGRLAAAALLLAAVPALAVLLLSAAPADAGVFGRACTTRAHHPGSYGAAAARNLSEFRGRILGDLLALSPPFTNTFGADGAAAWHHYDFASPFVTCPPGQQLLRYGKPGDGGKLLCDLSGLAAPCLVYSLGSNGDYSFEADILKRTPCDVHSFDCTFNGSSIQPARHYYHKVCLGQPPSDPEPSGARASDFKSLEGAMEWLGHEGMRIDVLKVDIEGHEVNVLSTLRPGQRLPEQLVVEVHMLRHDPIPGFPLSPATARDPAQMGLLLAHAAALGYGVAAREDNTETADKGCCTELTLLRVEGPGRHARWRPAWRRRAGGGGGGGGRPDALP